MADTTWLMCYYVIPFSKEEVEELKGYGLDITQPFKNLGELQDKFGSIIDDADVIDKLWCFIGSSGRNSEDLQLKVTNDLS